MKILRFLIIAVIASGCHKLHEGTVVSKDYHDSYFTVIMIPHTISTGKTITTYFTTIPVYYPESYSIDVEGKVNDEERTETFYIEKSEYDATEIGTFICVDEKCTERKYIEQ